MLSCLMAVTIASATALEPPASVLDDAAVEDLVRDAVVDNDGVNIHYVTGGEGELVVFLHGFPDYWYTWRDQIALLADDFQVAALDLRGYNLSDRPSGVANYAMPKLVSDVRAVVDDLGRDEILLVGHDWGAAIAWNYAMTYPGSVRKLVILSVPHPSGFTRELATNPEQQKNSQYARDFQKEGAHESLTAAGLAAWVKDPEARARYVEAFERSDFEAMLNYYKASYPRTPPAASGAAPAAPSFPRIPCPVLVIHGLQDRALNAAGHAGCWDWIDGDTTLLMVPDAGHFVHHDRPELVNETLHTWLLRAP